MKIGIDIRTAGGEKAGKGYYTFNLVQALLKLDTQNEYHLYTKDKFPGFEHFKNAKVHHITGRSIFWHRNVAKHARHQNLDYFFAPSSYIVPTLLPESIKSIFTVHDLVAFLHPSKHNKKAIFLERLYLKKAVKKSHKILAVSTNTKKDLAKKFPQAKEKTTVIYNAASPIFKPKDTATLSDFITRTKLPKHFFLSVGTIIPRKNYTRLIKAFRLHLRENPGHHLIIVGKPGWNHREVENAIKENHLQGHVHLLGYLTEESLANLYNLALAFVFPSLYEGFGIPLLEAMQSNCPVLSSDTSSMPEVVGDSALLFDPHSIHAISDAMQKIATDSTLRDKLIEKGQAQAQNFSWEESAKKLLEQFL